MKIEIHHIPQQGLIIDRRIQATAFETLKHLMATEEMAFIQDIGIKATVTPIQDMIQVQGSVQTCVRIACSRCAEKYDAPMRRQFELAFSRRIPQDLQPDGTDGIELTAQQIGLIAYQGDAIDLRDALAEQVILALPYKPLCSQECKGLCQRCGLNLNKGACQCKANDGGGPFDALKGLTFPSDESSVD